MTLAEELPAEESIVGMSQQVEEKETVEEDGAFEEEDLGNDDPIIGDEEEWENAAGNNDAEEDEDEDEEEDEDKSEPSTVQKPPSKPIKRARLAYSIFCDEKRLEIEQEVSFCLSVDLEMEERLLLRSIKLYQRHG